MTEKMSMKRQNREGVGVVVTLENETEGKADRRGLGDRGGAPEEIASTVDFIMWCHDLRK